MAMNVGSSSGSGDPEVMVDVNTTPLIDVMLVLLVMLIITIPIQSHEVKLDMPPPNLPPPPTPPQEIDIGVDFDGTFSWNGQTLPDRDALDALLQQEGSKPVAQQAEVHINPNRLVTYKYVAAVLASAQHLGVKKIGIVGGEQLFTQ